MSSPIPAEQVTLRPAQTIAVVDDDTRLNDLLRRYLCQHGFAVVSASNGQELLGLTLKRRIDLIILDIMMPAMDGMSLCRRLRSSDDRTPIIMLTAKCHSHSRILGLESGADDYLTKPFNPRELLARIRAVLSRVRNIEHPGAPSVPSKIFRFDSFELNLARRTLSKSGHDIPITTAEFSVLKVFARHPNELLSRDRLMALARGREYGAFDRSLDVQISRLRKLIEANPTKPAYIQTVWGKGYVFVCANA